MKTMVKRNDLVGAVATHLAPFARQLDGAFVGFGTAIGKEDAIEARCTGQAFGQLHRGLVVKSRRRIDQQGGLLIDGLDHVCRAMPQAVNRPALHEIQRSEEHTSELQSLMRISYAVFCLKKTNNTQKIA